MSKSPDIVNGIQEFQLDSWRKFYDFVGDELANYPSCICRGQGDANWKVEASIDRLETQFPIRKNFSASSPGFSSVPKEFKCPPASRENHLRAIKQAMRGRRGPNPQPLTDTQVWALAQHHGLATPLLDWTRSPFVALYFAFEEEHFIDYKNLSIFQPTNRVVYALSSAVIGEFHRDDDPAPRPISPTVETSERLLAQSGLFLEMPKKTDLETYVKTKFMEDSSEGDGASRAVLKKIVIKSEGRTDCLKMLNKMNINRMTLYPDLDGACEHINRMWALDFETSLGYIDD